MAQSLKIGILGTRGIPNRYGGFEQCAEYLALGLIEKGHKIWVYNSHSHEYQEGEWKGVHIIHCMDPEDKLGTFGQFIYDWNCIHDARKRDFDILLQLGYTSNSIWHLRWPRHSKNIVNMDGLEWKRSKYNKYVQRFLKSAEKWAAMHGDVLIADSVGIQEHLKDTYNRPSFFIPYGADVFEAPHESFLQPYSLAPYNYDILIARMEPENNIEMVIQGYLKSVSKRTLIVIGKTENVYGTYLKNAYTGNINIRFIGGVYDKDAINNLRYYSLLYFHGHSVGGTNPSLLEAMACNALICAHDNVFNKSVLGDDAFYFDNANVLATEINKVQSKEEYQNIMAHNIDKIRKQYSWQHIINEYEKVFFNSIA